MDKGFKLSKTMLIKNELVVEPRLTKRQEKDLKCFCTKKGFTLAETLVTLVVLGVIAALTVPQLVRRQQETANRVKFKKAVTSYESVMNKIAIMNDLKSNDAIKNWATKDGTISDCSVAYNYFKSVKDLSTNSKCKFKTADGVYWDITDIQKPIIAIKEADLTDTVAQSDTNRAFYLYAQYDGTGILRVTEPNFNYNLVSANADNVNNSVDRLWAYLNGATSTSQAEVASVTEPVVAKSTYQKWKDGEYDDLPLVGAPPDYHWYPCVGCRQTSGIFPGDMSYSIIDENGKHIGHVPDAREGADNPIRFMEYVYDDSNSITSIILYDENNSVVTTLTPNEVHNYMKTNTNSYYDFYCNSLGCTSNMCFVQGTEITLADGSKKAIEDIDFNDELKVWDFDNGCSTCAKPIWIREETLSKSHTVLTFSNGKELRIITNHSIFNVDEGKFTYPVEGMRTIFEDGTIATLEKKEIIEYPVKYYNVVTENHLNMYADDVLVSCRLNNMYPIKDMKFVKDDRELVPYEEFEGIPYEWYQKLRLAEQPRDINRDGKLYLGKNVREYVLQMMASNKRQMAVV